MKSSGELKLFVFITLGALALCGAVFIPSMLAKPPNEPVPVVMPPKINRQFLIPEGSHIRGSADAPFSIVEFSDFECSHCKDAQPRVEMMLKKFQPKLNMVYRTYRAVPSHLNAFTLAYAAEAAGLQGKFFEMADRIFANQDHYEGATSPELRDMIMKMAKSVGLDMTRFQADFDGPVVKKKVELDGSIGIDANVEGTPAFFFVTPSGKVTKLQTPQLLIDHLSDQKNWN